MQRYVFLLIQLKKSLSYHIDMISHGWFERVGLKLKKLVESGFEFCCTSMCGMADV